MLRWACMVFVLLVTVKGSSVLESEFVKRILLQDPSFCFRLASSDSCGGRTTLAFLFTEHRQDRPELLCGSLHPNSTFDPGRNTEVFIHGFLDGVCRSAWMREMKSELFKRDIFNVILVDWTWGNGPRYEEGVKNTKEVGKQISALLQNIMLQTGVGPENFHLIGHSLGAHIAGFAGKTIKHLRRITALDPALDPFQNRTSSERLDSTDANLVDVIHTNGGTKPGEALGDIQALGHSDFYPNGGQRQDGCRHHILRSYMALDFLYATISLVPRICSHMHAVQYYKASINRCRFVGVECSDYESFASGGCVCENDCSLMGMDHTITSISYHRKFFLNTTILYPYCDNTSIEFQSTPF